MALIDGAGDIGLPKVKQPSSANAPKSLPLIAGIDYCAGPEGAPNEEGYNDLELGGDLIIEDSPGYASRER